ncbi:MAG: hypothetical protein JKY30_04355 [Flavobacteriales bacterium]|nr:hypothetical protein [Flavobacteriales bacterium]
MKKVLKLGVVFLLSQNAVFAQFDMGGGGKIPKQKFEEREVRPFSKVQKKHYGEIMFSNSHIAYMKEDESKFISKYNLGDPLYYRVYQTKTLEEGAMEYFLKKEGKEVDYQEPEKYTFLTVIKINGKEIATYEKDKLPKAQVTDWVGCSGYIVSSDKEKNGGRGFLVPIFKRGIHGLGNKLVPGTYELEIDIYAVHFKMHEKLTRKEEDRVVKISSGKLTLSVTAEGINKYTKNLCSLVKKPKNVRQNESLINKIKYDFEKATSKLKVEIIYMLDNDWYVRKNNNGTIKDRAIIARVVYRKGDGSVWWKERQVKQKYLGNGIFEKGITFTNEYNNRPLCPVCIDYYNSKNN